MANTMQLAISNKYRRWQTPINIKYNINTTPFRHHISHFCVLPLHFLTTLSSLSSYFTLIVYFVYPLLITISVLSLNHPLFFPQLNFSYSAPSSFFVLFLRHTSSTFHYSFFSPTSTYIFILLLLMPIYLFPFFTNPLVSRLPTVLCHSSLSTFTAYSVLKLHLPVSSFLPFSAASPRLIPFLPSKLA
jgi:hypothetical protein